MLIGFRQGPQHLSAPAGYWSLMACRALVGVGEACFVALAAPFIGASRRFVQNIWTTPDARSCAAHCSVLEPVSTDDNAPAASMACWLAIF